MATTKETLDKWMDITLKDLQSSLAADDIGVSGDLSRSIFGRVQANEVGGRMQINYLWYGKMRDMGVRRGVTLQQAMSGNRSGWWSSVMNRRMPALQEIMINVYGSQAVATIKEALPGQVTFKM